MSIFFGENQEQAESLVNKMLPEDREEMKKLIANLCGELMQKSSQVDSLKKELVIARKRKKAKHNPMLGHVALVMFSRPKADPNAKVRMHSADNVQSSLALQTVKRMLQDPDHEFIGAYFLQPMKGKKDGYERLQTNSEAVWHLFEKLDNDCKVQDPELSSPESSGEDG